MRRYLLVLVTIAVVLSLALVGCVAPQPVNKAPTVTLDYPPDGHEFPATTTSVTLKWTGTDEDGDQLYYELYVNNTLVATKTGAPGEQKTHHYGVQAGQTYVWYVKVSDGKDQAQSGPRMFTIQQPPAPPANKNPNVTLDEPDNNATFPATTTSVILKWTGTDEDGDQLYYELYVNDTLVATKTGASGEQQTYDYDEVQAGQTYVWYVKVSDGKVSVPSTPRTFRIASAANNPPSVTLIKPGNNETFKASTSFVMLEWKAEDADGDPITYTLWVNNVKKDELSGDSGEVLSFNLEVEAGKTYTWKVIANDGKGGIDQKSASFSVNEWPDLEPNSARFLCPATVTLDWADWSEELSFEPNLYTIYYATSATCTTPEPDSFAFLNSGTPTNYVWGNIRECGIYFWYVRACDDQGNEATSKIYMFCVLPEITIYFYRVGEDGEVEETEFASETIAYTSNQNISISINPADISEEVQIVLRTSCGEELPEWLDWEVQLEGEGLGEVPQGPIDDATATWTLFSTETCFSEGDVPVLCSSWFGERIMTITVRAFASDDPCCPACCELVHTINVSLSGHVAFGLAASCENCGECGCGYLFLETSEGLEATPTVCGTITIAQTMTQPASMTFIIPADTEVSWIPILDFEEGIDRYYLCLNPYHPAVSTWKIESGKTYYVTMPRGSLFLVNDYGVYFGYPCSDWERIGIRAE